MESKTFTGKVQRVLLGLGILANMLLSHFGAASVILAVPRSVLHPAASERYQDSSVPILVSPPDGSTTPDITPSFSWERVPDANRYHIRVDDNPDFSSPALDFQTDNPGYTPRTVLAAGIYFWHVRARKTDGWGEYSSAWVLIVDGAPPPAPTLLTPPDGSTTPDLTPPFDWDDVPGADHYRIQVDDNADFSSPAADSEPTGSTYTPGNQLPNGTCYWRVRANDGMGNWGGYSQVWTLIVDGTPPPAPTLLAPPDGSTTPDLTPPFDWDDVAGADHYRIQVDDTADFSSPAADSQPDSSAYTPSNQLPNGTYYWRVRANDGMGNWGGYSLTWTLTVSGTPPPAPTLLAPPDGSTTSDLTPAFDWDDVPGADHYRIQVDDNADFSSPAADSDPAGSAYTPGNQLPNGTYYWRVRANDGMGNWGGYSLTWTLTVSGTPPPAPPLLAPPDGSTTSDLTPAFDWDDVPGADHYRIQVDDNADFSSPAADSDPAGSAYTPGNQLPNGTYYWRVRASDGMGNWGGYSLTWTLTVSGTPPPAPTLVTPPNGSTTTDLTPGFDWSDVPGADHYHIQVDDNADFSSPTADSQPTSSAYTPGNQLPNGTYYWHVRTADNMGNWGDYSAAWQVSVSGSPPSPPTLIAPPDGSTIPDLTPSFDWNNVPGASRYRIQVDNDADFSSPTADSQPTNSAYTPGNQLPNGTYYWHVRTADNMGNWGDYSAAWQVSVSGSPPSPPTLVAPPDGSTTPDLTPSFDWNNVPGASHYRIQVDNDADFSSPAADSQPNSSAYTPINQLPIGTLYWHVRTADGIGNWGNYGATWRVIINGTRPPALALLSPSDGSTTSDLTPSFDWNDVSGASHYRIQVDDNPDFSSPAADAQPNSSTYTPSKQLPNGTYYWRVRANDGLGNWGDYSVAWRVIINGAQLPPPTLIAPPNGSTTSDLTPPFDWSDVAGADHYRVQVDDNSDFSSPAADSQPTRSSYSPNKQLAPGLYYWRVRAADTKGNWGEYSAAWSVTIGGAPPQVPTLIAPPDGSTTPDITPSFDWSDVPGAGRYRIQVDDNTDFSSPLADSQPNRSAYTPRTKLEVGTYYWRVRAADTMGNWGEYSAAWRLAVTIAPTEAPAPTAPPTTASAQAPGLVLRDTTGPMPVLSPTSKTAYLTFDDGPDPSYTPQLVAYLQQRGVQATFFLTGGSRSGSGGELYVTCTPGPGDLVTIDALNGTRVVEVIDKGGFGIGLHGWFHGSVVHPQDLWDDAVFDPRSNIAQEERALAILGVSFERFLRAPGGAFPQTPFSVYQDWYYYGWDVDARDGYGVSPQAIVDNVMNGLSATPDDPIILLHSGRPNTLQAIVDPQYDLIGRITALGYTRFDRLPRPNDHTGYPPNGSLYSVGH